MGHAPLLKCSIKYIFSLRLSASIPITCRLTNYRSRPSDFFFVYSVYRYELLLVLVLGLQLLQHATHA